jgi:glycosyltransferase involved in cell wall biosynthesis
MDAIQPPIDRTKVIGNGVDAQRFFPEDRRSARNRLGLNQAEEIVVSVAALRQVKGPDLLLRAAALLRNSGRHCRVIFVGAGPELPSLQRLARQLECEHLVTFAGKVNNQDLRFYFSAANVSCIPSRNEGWPNVLLESLACGTPVVATRVGAATEILADTDLGVLVDPAAESICDGLRKALDHTWNQDQLVGCASTHTWDEVATATERFLEDSVQCGFSAAQHDPVAEL